METKKRTRHAESIPHEIVFDILTRLPVKSLLRFRCVSQLWNTTISDRLFVKTHHNRSLTRPTTLLITFAPKTNIARTIYTADHRENPVGAVRHLITISGVVASYVSESVNGLICLKVNKHIHICNPSTREFITLPYLEIETPPTPTSPLNGRCVNRTSFGYDPINNQHKVLNTWIMMNIEGTKMETEHRIFVLGADSWRKIGDGPPYFSRTQGVSVNGAIYYTALTTVVNEFPYRNLVLVEFDVRLETFRFIQLPDNLWQLKNDHSAFIPFDGHFAIVDYQLRHGNTIKIWVLEDSLKPSWVHKSIVFPSASIDILGDREFWLSGTIRTSEIILAPRSLKKPFYLFYLDLKNVSVRRGEIGSLPDDNELEFGVAFNNMIASDHVENILSLRNLNF